jgi:hypothetical protein
MTDLTAPIFDSMYAYPCFVPYITTLDQDEVATYGIRCTGVEELDEHLDTMQVKVYITIDRMIDLYTENHPVRIATQKAAKQVYESLTTYSQHWAGYIKAQSLNQARLPVEDLIIMEDFASRLRPAAIDGMPLEDIQCGLTNMLDGLLSVTQNLVLDHNNELLELFKDYQQRNR